MNKMNTDGSCGYIEEKYPIKYFYTVLHFHNRSKYRKLTKYLYPDRARWNETG